MHKIFYIIFFASFCLYSQSNSIVILRSNTSKYRKIEFGLKSQIKHTLSITSIVPKNEAEIIQAVTANSPNMVIAMDVKPIGLWKKACTKKQEFNSIPSILIENDASASSMETTSNNCIITFEIKLSHYIDRVTHYTGNKPKNVGVIYSSKSGGLAKSYIKESSKLGVNLHAKPVVVSDLKNSVSSIVNNYINHYNVDCIIILDDYAVINNKNINDIWVSLLRPLKIPVVIPSDYLYELEPRIGSFAIQPHYIEIGRVVASIITATQANKWILRHKSVYVDKSIFFFRNSKGSISKREHIHNDIIATYHRKPSQKQDIQLAAAKIPKAERNDFQNEDTVHDYKRAVKKDTQPSSISIVRVEKPPEETTIPDVALVNNIPAEKVTKTDHTGSVKPALDTERVKHRTISTAKQSDDTEQAPQRNVPGAVDSTTNISQYADTSDRDTFSIEITAMTTNIYKESSPGSKVVGIGRSGDKLIAYSEDSLWFRVDFFGIQGFLSKTDAHTITKTDTSDRLPIASRLRIIYIIIVLLAIAILIFLLIRLLLLKYSTLNRIDCLLIAKKSKRITYSKFDNRYISLGKYLTNFGYHVKMTKNLKKIDYLLFLHLPDIICIDCQFETHIQDTIINILKKHILTADFILIFYNVDVSYDTARNGFLIDRTFNFGYDFTVADLNSSLTVIKNGRDASSQQSDSSHSSLEGKISEDTLTEILQLMDINKKTGCLLIKDHDPVGMIFFESGVIVYAITNSFIAENAVFEILSMKHGRFQFLPGKKPITKQMRLNVVAVLMEKAKRIDENSKL